MKLKRYIIANVNGALSSFDKIRAFLTTLSVVTCLSLLEPLSEVYFTPFLRHTEVALNGRGCSIHYNQDKPDDVYRSTMHDIIGCSWNVTIQGEEREIRIVSCYRNQQTDSIDEFSREIERATFPELKFGSKNSNKQIIIWGDFNAESAQLNLM